MQLICTRITKINVSAEAEKLLWFHVKAASVEGFSLGRVRWDIGEEEVPLQVKEMEFQLCALRGNVCRGPECCEIITQK